MNPCVQRCLQFTFYAHIETLELFSLLMYIVILFQVEEAVAVLQAHQAKKDATQKVGGLATTAAATS